MQPALFDARPGFSGETFEPELDTDRLSRQLDVIRNYVLSVAGWVTLSELSKATGVPEASASARLRDLRKPKHGGYTVERRRRGELKRGWFEYRITP